MNRIENNGQLAIINPYRSEVPQPEDTSVSAIAQKNLSPNDQTKLISLGNRVINWAKFLLFRDYEKHLAIADKGAWLLDKGVLVVVGSMQAAVIADGLFHINIVKSGTLSFIPHVLKLLLSPAAIFFLVIGIIEAIFELINLKRGVELLHGTEKEGLNWVKNRYFTLQKAESDKIVALIEEKLPELDQTAKAEHFDQIAERALAVKFENLKRRITPGLAEAVKVELDSIMKDFQSSDEAVRAAAADRTKLLMESISTQAKNKILIHVLGIIAIFFTILSAIGMLSGVGAIGFFIAMAACTAIAVTLKFIVQKGYYEKEVERFYDKIANLQRNTPLGQKL